MKNCQEHEHPRATASLGQLQSTNQVKETPIVNKYSLHREKRGMGWGFSTDPETKVKPTLIFQSSDKDQFLKFWRDDIMDVTAKWPELLDGTSFPEPNLDNGELYIGNDWFGIKYTVLEKL